MIYNSLDTIPYKLFLKIAGSGDISLLATEPTDADLQSIWEKLSDEHLSKHQTSESQKIFRLSKNIDELLTSHKVIVFACDALRFEYDVELDQIIQSYGFVLPTDDVEKYYKSLHKIARESKAFVIKAERYQSMLPEKEETKGNKYSVDDVMASYSMILGYNIGKHNEITYAEYYAFEKSVNAKIESMKTQKTSQNGK